MTKKIKIGDIYIGGGETIKVQSMTKTDTKNVKSTIEQIKRLEKVGCEIIRVSIPDVESANSIPLIKKNISIPLVADVHFNHKLALLAIEKGADKIRINPSNIGSKEKVKMIINVAKERKIPIRIGLNSGSVRFKNEKKEEELVGMALEWISFFEDQDFFDIVVSIKSSDIQTTIKSYELISKKIDYPLHIGLTEAGPVVSGAVKSSIALSSLLSKGIGDTIRVSLTGPPEEEVKVAYKILEALNLRKRGFEIISCPTCARCKVDLIKVVNEVEKRLLELKPIHLKVAIMGCEVNGPGEAKDADIGVACGRGCGLIFKHRKAIKKVREKNLVEELINEISRLRGDYDD